MKRVLFTLVLLCGFNLFGQTIKFNKVEGGIIEVPVSVNGIGPIDFILDTGASECSIPIYLFKTLVMTGVVRRDDMLAERSYKLADGSVSSNSRFIIRELKVGGVIFKNVSCSINNNSDSPFLLGQNVLREYKVIKIYNVNGVIKLEK